MKNNPPQNTSLVSNNPGQQGKTEKIIWINKVLIIVDINLDDRSSPLTQYHLNNIHKCSWQDEMKQMIL